MYDILKEALYLAQPNIDKIFEASRVFHKHLTVDLFIKALSKTDSPLYFELELQETTCSRLLKRVFPLKRGNTKAHTYLLSLFDLKYCPCCSTIKEYTDFQHNNTRKDGIASHCRACSNSDRTEYQRSYQAGVRAKKLERTPKWANSKDISTFYSNCPEGYHVDHIVPLQGELVCGLHVLNNLQYLTAEDNLKKNNKFIV